MKRLSKMINGRSSSSSKTRPASAAEQAEAENITTQKLKFASLHEDGDDDDEAAQRLRQNPRKNMGKVSSSKNVVNNHQQKFVCHKCGKAFQSSKAMCGHMACHSEKEKPSSNAVAKKKVVLMDSESDTESGAVQRRRRLRRARCKKNDYVPDAKVAKFDVANNCSSEASGIEQEQEEVAICLMMLSRDSANWGGLNLIGESSDNNSVVLEDRSISTKLGNKDGLSSAYDLNEAKQNHTRKHMKSLGDFDTGHAKNVVRNVETGVKIRTFRMNKLDEELKSEPHLSLKKLKSLMDGEGYSQVQRHWMESDPMRGVLNESYSAGVRKIAEHEALTCSRSAKPFHANAACNKQFTDASPGQNSVEADAYHSKRKGKGKLDDKLGNVGNDWKKGKFESPVYPNEFGSGQNVVSHRRVHLAEESQDDKYDEVLANHKRNGIRSHGFIDLNLPAPAEDEDTNESMGSH